MNSPPNPAMRARPRAYVLALMLTLTAALSCDSFDSPTIPKNKEICSGYPPWETSPYVLPYPVGRAHRVSQGNCTSASHQGTLRYSYDFEMPFGSVVTAARPGTVFAIRVDQPSGTRGRTSANYVQIQHADGIVSDYIHLAPGGNLVEVGQTVRAGDPIAITGDTGDVGSFPHVQFDLSPCANSLGCDTLPVTFRYTSPNPGRPQENVVYEALPYDGS